MIYHGSCISGLHTIKANSKYHSTGKMGYAVAKTAARRGAKVTLVSGPVNLLPPRFVETVQIESAAMMYDEVIKRADEQDIIIKAAAVADYTPENTADEKIKKKDGGEMSIPLKRTKDILKTLGENKKENQFICGFSMETQNMLENSKKKLEKKNVDMIVANNLKVAGAGFGTDTNIVTLITKDKSIIHFNKTKSLWWSCKAGSTTGLFF